MHVHDDRTFVLALDDSVDMLDSEDTAACRYRQLAFFHIPDLPVPDDAGRWLEPISYVDCDAFSRNEHGEVTGELHYDPESGQLIALSDGDGACVLSLDGHIVTRLPDIDPGRQPAHGDFGSRYSGTGGWSYAPQHRVFYRWVDGVGIHERALPAAHRAGPAS